MALDPISAGLDLANTVVSRIWPDKTAEEQQQLAAVLTMVQGQMQINQAEATSTDPLQHWRGGLGWVCVAGYAWNYVLEPIASTAAAFMHYAVTLNRMDMTELSTLTVGMLGLGVTHAWQQVNGK